ncbi:MAG TPA: hypothetical protein VF260_01845 [Bacilli bacterium]
MNLAEMLSYADIRQLNAIARHYACECSGHSKNELIQSILMTINRKDVFEQVVRELSEEDLRFVNSLLFDRRESFSLEDLLARAKAAVYDNERKELANPRETIAKFKYRGWLFNGCSQKTKYLLQVPRDVKTRFRDTLADYFASRLSYSTTPPFYRDEESLIADDILVFLKFVYHHEPPLTADGVMYKRMLQQLLERLTVADQPLGKGGWRFGYGRRFRDYPNRFSLIYDYCHYHSLIAETEQNLVVTEAGAAAVVQARREDMRQIYRFWLRLYKGAIPNLPSLTQWVGLLAKRWVHAPSLSRLLCPLIKPFYYDSPENIFQERILQMLLHLGVVRIGETEDGAQLVQVTPLGTELLRGTYVAEEDKIVLPELPVDSGMTT